ncbi:MAG: helix-turn-helix domain-containing protein [Burkholderiales bacterium]|nr:helix-turn-helix domain-containing protein [Burkholderiales bacterium]
MPAPNSRIRSYSLFGESSQLPDLMHCETIAARSVLHDWELEPHRHARLHQLLLVVSGGGTAHLEGEEFALAPMALVNVAAGDVHGFSFSRPTAGYVVTLPDEMREELTTHAGDARVALARSRVLAADEAIAATVRLIGQEYAGRGSARSLVLRGLCGCLLGLTARAARGADAVAGPAAASTLMRRFEAALEAHYLEHWKVADYARALAVSPTHLSRVARAATGAPASRLIDARVIREAQRHLAYTNMSVTTIADTLGYADLAYFSRVFARVAGLPPRAFRARLAS